MFEARRQAKRALEIAAAGHHNIVLNGRARMREDIAGAMSAVDHATYDTGRGFGGHNDLLSDRTIAVGQPLDNEPTVPRAAHYTISNAGLIGRRKHTAPWSEVTLSHRGVLFLDELPEFGNATLETLRQPLEDRSVTISRARTSATYPAKLHVGRRDESVPMWLPTAIRSIHAPVANRQSHDTSVGFQVR